MDDWDVVPREAAAVDLKAIEQGVARKLLSREELMDKAAKIVGRAQRQTKPLMNLA